MDTTERGFGLLRFEYQDYDSTQPRTFSVQESSLATELKIWIGPDSPEILVNNAQPSAEAAEHYARAHLNHVEARRVRNALTELLGDVEVAPTSSLPFAASEAEGRRRYPGNVHDQQIFIEAVEWAVAHHHEFPLEEK